MTKFLVLPVNTNWNDTTQFFTKNSDGEIIPIEEKPKISAIKMIKSDEEKLKRRRIYRQQYTKRPDVRAKIKKRLNDPKVIEARKAYAEKPEVKLRKKQLSAASRALKKKLKEEYPTIHDSLITEVIKEREQKENSPEFHCGTCDRENGLST